MNYANTINDHLPALRGRVCVAVRRTARAVGRYPVAGEFGHRLRVSRSHYATPVRNDRSSARGDRYSGPGRLIGDRIERQSWLAAMGMRSANHYDARPLGQTLRGADGSARILGHDPSSVHDSANPAGHRNRGTQRAAAAGWTISQLAAKLAALLSNRQVKP